MYHQQDLDFLLSSVDSLTDSVNRLLISEWAEENRYLPPELTSKPGMWDNGYTPYLVKPMDAMSPQSPTREIVVMKAAQVGATTGMLENPMGYTIQHYPCGIMYITADAELSKVAVELKVDSMLKNCDLQDLIKSQDSKKTGNTSTKKEFPGGFILPVGARSPGRLRSISVRMILADELDGMPDKLGNEGDTVELFRNRTNAFEETKKILYLSTPLVQQTSKIHALYLQGNQQKYFIPCPHCGHMQYLRLQGVRKDGKKFAFHYEVDDNFRLIRESVGYICEECLMIFKNHDKTFFLSQGEWRPTAVPQQAFFESYWLPSYYSPVGMYSWESLCQDWLKWWDVKNQRVKDIEAYRSFRNTKEGWPWEEKGAAPRFERVIQHRRAIYSRNEIPNRHALKETGSNILILTLAADVHKNRIDVEIKGWCRDGRSYSIDWRHLNGSTEELSTVTSPWVKLSKIIESETWKADDGKKYGVAISFIDAGYNTGFVYDFCGQYSEGVYPVFGRDSLPSNKSYTKTLFLEGKNKHANLFYSLNVTTYKDRLAAWLRSDWKDGEVQPVGYPNYPGDYGDDYFRQYEAEEKFTKVDKKTNRNLGFVWIKKPNADNHAWDCAVYNMAALDFYAFNVCVNQLGEEGIVYDKFWDWLEKNHQSA